MDTKDFFKIVETKKKTSKILAECKKLFSVWSYHNDEQLDKDFPPPKKITTRYFAKNVEADEQYANKSAIDLKKEGGDFITLRERLLLELAYFRETSEHLDVKNITLCAGSRHADGYVPLVYWYSLGRELSVYWFHIGYSHPHLRARAAFLTLPTSKLVPLGEDLGLLERVKALEEWRERITNVFNKVP